MLLDETEILDEVWCAYTARYAHTLDRDNHAFCERREEQVKSIQQVLVAFLVALLAASFTVGCGSSHHGSGGGGGTGGGGGGTQPVSIVTAPTLPQANINSSYNTALFATGGTGSYTWTLVSGSLPTGLTLSAGGSISGTPTSQGNSGFTLKVTDTGSGSAQQGFTLAVSTPVQLTPTVLPAGTLGTAYSQQITATGGGGAPYVFSINAGSAPLGLTLSNTGLLSGTPTGTGTFNFTVKATSADTSSALSGYSVKIN